MFRIVAAKHFQKWMEDGRIGHPEKYFRERDIFLDCRGPVEIAPTSNWGYNVTVITASHSLRPEDGFRHCFWPVVVEDGAWICSGALLYNCRVGEGAVVAAGCVVRSRDVPPRTMVEGNPAQAIARKEGDVWAYFRPAEPLPTHVWSGKERKRYTIEDVRRLL